MAWTSKTKTLTGTTSLSLPINAKKFNMFLLHGRIDGATPSPEIRFNADSGSDYALRRANNGAADSTSVSQTELFIAGSLTTDDDYFTIGFFSSFQDEDKLVIGFTNEQQGTGAANISERQEWVAKFIPSPEADVTEINAIENSDKKYVRDSNLTAFGSD